MAKAQREEPQVVWRHDQESSKPSTADIPSGPAEWRKFAKQDPFRSVAEKSYTNKKHPHRDLTSRITFRAVSSTRCTSLSKLIRPSYQMVNLILPITGNNLKRTDHLAVPPVLTAVPRRQISKTNYKRRLATRL